MSDSITAKVGRCSKESAYDDTQLHEQTKPGVASVR